MIRLLTYLAHTLEKEQLYDLAMFLTDNPEIIDESTLLHIINEVDKVEMDPMSSELSKKVQKMKDHFEEIDKKTEMKQNSTLYKLLKDNNIGLN